MPAPPEELPIQIGWSFSPLLTASRPTAVHNAEATPQESASRTKRAERDDSPLADLQKQLDALATLEQLPRRSAEQRASTLVKRMEELKAKLEMLMMFGASPAQLKRIARELKSIAGQLGDAAKQLDGGTTGGTGVPNIATAQLSQAAQSKMPATEESQATRDSDAKAASAEAAARQAAATGAGEQLRENQDRDERRDGGAGGSDDSTLRETLVEARKLLRELIGKLKSAADREDRDTRSQLEKAEEQLRKLDTRLMDSRMPQRYGATGNSTTAAVAMPALNIGSLSVRV